jgi:2-oxoisovalerate dehydrogenase E2 component (dihydrolipoyl transacylase)
MSIYCFKLPDLGEGTVESEIVEWHVKIGEHIVADQALVDMMTDKATVEITSPVSGKVVSLSGNPGDIIAVGLDLAEIDTNIQDSVETGDSCDVTNEESVTLDSAPLVSASNINTRSNELVQSAAVVMKPLTSPSIRRIAQENDVDLTQLRGTGPKGRITRDDIEQFIASHKDKDTSNNAIKHTAVRKIKVIGLRRKIAENMAISASRIPHYAYVEELDVTELDRLRQHMNARSGEKYTRLTYLPFFMRALVKVLGEFPQCNARFDDENNIVTQFDAIHIGIATQTDNGLMVPVVKHVEALDIWECADEILRLSIATKNGQADKAELVDSTITISSLGAAGGIMNTPIINYPEVAIIGINKIQERPVVVNGMITTRLMMNLSSSFDHRVVDGYDAARMIQALKSCLENPATIFV